MKKFVRCKKCGAEIYKGAKICPQCGAKNKGSFGILLLVIAVIVIAFFICEKINQKTILLTLLQLLHQSLIALQP